MSRLRPLRLVGALVALLALVAACSSEPPTVIVSGNDPTTGPKNIIETLEADGGYTILLELLEHAGLTDLLEDPEAELTLFAPTDAAWADLGEGVDLVLKGEEDVYIVPADDAAPAADEEPAADAEAEEGEAEAEATDEEPADEDPPADEVADEEEAEEEADQPDADADAPVVPVAPLSSLRTSELLTALLSYHVVDGLHLSGDLESVSSLPSIEGAELEIGTREEPAATEGGEPTLVITVDDADIVSENLLATNGVIQTVDSVLVPEDFAADLDQLIGSIPVATDVMSTLRMSDDHGELVVAIETAGLDGELSDLEAVTIFAPTDAAFAALTDEQRAALEDPEVLREVLLFHTVGRAVAEEDIQNRESIASLEGQRLLVVKDGDVYTVEGVTIDDEIPATNGGVLVISQILIPESAQGPGGL